MRALVIALAASVVLAVAAPAVQAGAPRPCDLHERSSLPGSGEVLRVPQEHPTIGAAVAAAHDDDTILVSPGVYREAVDVPRGLDGLRIRGTDRDAVILDGRPPEGGEPIRRVGIHIAADRVMVENMTLRYFVDEAVHWHRYDEGEPLTGFWGRYLTVHGTSHAGVLAAGARCGQLDHIVTSGSVYTGLVVQGCDPCDTLVTDTVSAGNGTGFAAVDAGARLMFGEVESEEDARVNDDNELTGNQVGVLVALEDPLHLVTDPAELPALVEHRSTRGPALRDNHIHDNNVDEDWPLAPCRTLPGSPACDPVALKFNGNGVLLLNTRGVRVERNTVEGNRRMGIQVAGVQVPALGNVVRDNVTSGNGYPSKGPRSGADLAQDAVVGPGNCWSGNVGKRGGEPRTVPPALQTAWSCERATTPPGGVNGTAQCAVWSLPPTSAACWRSTAGGTPYWETKPVAHPGASVDAPADEGAVDAWLPELRAALERPE